ncbi:hypothetical protein LCGC14_0561850 [marine sediment metagenome]|uniref:Depolymerase 2 capsule K5-specific C-terminal domain-containing protein n=1 Tax=marine sediment metagenome TaxID=412755 RepID=A0A0F9UV01_9ZZZZ
MNDLRNKFQSASKYWYVVALVAILLVVGSTVNVYGDGLYVRWQRFGAILVNELLVTNNTALGNSANDTLTVKGDVVFTGIPDTDTTSYNEWFLIEGDMTGTGGKDRNFGLVIEMTRPSGQEITTGDHLEAALKIAIDTEAVTTTLGTTMRAIDAEAKADNPGGTVSNLIGASITAKSDTSAGTVHNMTALTLRSQNNAAVTGTLMIADFALDRQAATVPTAAYGLQIRNSSSTGAGADAAIYVKSDYSGSATTDRWTYGLDLSGSVVTTADIRLSNGETVSNVTDTAVQISGFLALEEAATQDLTTNGWTLTATTSYQPVTVAGSAHTTSGSGTAIADGPVAGALLVLCNEDATYNVIVKDGANTKIGGDITLTAGQDDCLTMLWNGADWVGLSDMDN